MYTHSIALVTLVTIANAGVVDHGESKRVLSSKPLSDKERHEDEGDFDYDHEAFLGEDQADYFDTLTPDESQVLTNQRDRKSTRLNSSHSQQSRMPSSA